MSGCWSHPEYDPKKEKRRRTLDELEKELVELEAELAAMPYGPYPFYEDPEIAEATSKPDQCEHKKV